MQRKSAFSRRLPDLVTEELVAVLSKKGATFEFKQLFDVVHDRLKKRNAASGGEEMLRLRAYEKLQHLVSRNMVKKSGKKYKGLASLAHAIAPEDPLPPAVIFGAPAVVSITKKPATAKVPAAKVPTAKAKSPKTAKPAAKVTKPSAKKPTVKKVTTKKTVVKVVAKKVVKKPAKKSSK
ncbi:MAG: hypothetical protein WCI42_01750 [Verrucomicrobiota bacterium]